MDSEKIKQVRKQDELYVKSKKQKTKKNPKLSQIRRADWWLPEGDERNVKWNGWKGGVPIVAQWKWIWLVSMRRQVRSLASFSMSGIQRCCDCGVHRLADLTPSLVTSICKKKKKKKEMGEGGQKVQTSSYKIIKFWGCKMLSILTIVNHTFCICESC